MQNLSLLVAVGLFITVVVATAGYAYGRNRRSSQLSWDDLLGRLSRLDAAIDRNDLGLVPVDETGKWIGAGDPATLEPSLLWTLVGGLEGLERLEANSDVLIDMAAYLQQWYPEAVVIAERLRLDARELKWHVGRLRGASKTGNLLISFPFYAQRAILTYCLMTRRVLELYEAGNFSALADPQPALARGLWVSGC